MHKILILSLLFAMLAVPAGAQTENEFNKLVKFFAYAIQSFGWKCNEIQNLYYGDIEVGTKGIPGQYSIYKVTCEGNLIYLVRETGRAHANNILFTFCHKGTCKKFE